MKHSVLLSLLLICFGGCICCNAQKLPISSNNKISILEGVHLIISPLDTIITQELKISCKVFNENKDNVAILGRFDITTIESPEYVWCAVFFFKKSEKKKMSPFTYLGDFKLPTKEEYIILKPGESKEFIFTFDFDNLGDSPEITTEHKNTDYGEYTIILSYKDVYCKHEYALKGQIESNKIKVTYKK